MCTHTHTFLSLLPGDYFLWSLFILNFKLILLALDTHWSCQTASMTHKQSQKKTHIKKANKNYVYAQKLSVQTSLVGHKLSPLPLFALLSVFLFTL